MSYILDAMRKTERDRTLGTAKQLPPADGGWRSKLLTIGLTLLIAGLVAIGIWLALAVSVGPAPVVSQSPRIDGVKPSEPKPVTPVAPTITVTRQLTPALSPKPAARLPASISPSARVTVAIPADWRELPDTGQVAGQLPESLVQLRIGIHVYDKQVEKQMVLINGRRYRPGDSLAEGTKIIEITPAGMVLEYQAIRFHKRR